MNILGTNILGRAYFEAIWGRTFFGTSPKSHPAKQQAMNMTRLATVQKKLLQKAKTQLLQKAKTQLLQPIPTTSRNA